MPMKTADPRRHYRTLCSIKAHVQLGLIIYDVEIVDISEGGCKIVPSSPDELIDAGLSNETDLDLRIGNECIFGGVVWSAPNFAAIGCRFDQVMNKHEIAAFLKSSHSVFSIPCP